MLVLFLTLIWIGIDRGNKMGLWSCILYTWYGDLWWECLLSESYCTLCANELWTGILLHKISTWENQILEYYLSLYAWIMDVDIYFYFYDNTCFIPCKDHCCKIGIICRFYRRNNIISIQVLNFHTYAQGDWNPKHTLCSWTEKMKNIHPVGEKLQCIFSATF